MERQQSAPRWANAVPEQLLCCSSATQFNRQHTHVHLRAISNKPLIYLGFAVHFKAALTHIYYLLPCLSQR